MNVRIYNRLVCLFLIATGGCYSPDYQSDSDIVNAQSYDDIVTRSTVGLPDNSILTVEQAISIAKQNSPSLKSTWHAITAAKNRKLQSYASYYPSVSYTGSMGETKSSLRYSELGDDGTLSRENSVSNALSAQLILFDGFAREIGVMIAKSDEKSKDQAYADALRLLTKSVKLQYYKIILAVNNRRIAKDNLEFQRELLDISRKKYDLKLVKIDEVLNFEANVNQGEDAIIQAEYSIQVEREILARLMGIEIATLNDSVQLSDLDGVDYQLMGVETYLDMALNNRPDLKQQRLLIDIAAYKVDLEETEYMPVITLGGLFSADRSRSRVDGTLVGNSRSVTRSGSINMTWNLFNGFQTYYSVKEAEALLKQQELSMESAWILAASEVRQAYLGLKQATSRDDLLLKRVEINTRRRDLLKRSYTSGLINVTELNEAQLKLNSAQAQYNQVKINIHEYIAQLNAAIGVAE